MSGRLQRWILMAMALLAALATAPLQAAATGRVAIVLVAQDYQKLQKSRIGVKLANDLAEALQAKGFDVLQGANTTNARTRAILLDFSRKAEGADLALAFLLGHATATNGQTYFLPVDVELSAATDLFSHGISVASVAHVASGAKAGGVFVLMTTPNFEPAVPGLNQRPEYASENPKTVVTVFSSSAKLPVSRIDAASESAAEGVVKLLQQPAPTLADLARTVSAESGAIFGAPADINLAKPSPAPPPVATASADKTAADRRAPDGAAQAETARLQVQQARAEAEKAKAEAQRAQAEAARAIAEAEKAKSEASAERARGQSEEKPAATIAASPPMDENLIGKKQRQRIQERLKEMSLYTGPIDSIMGPLTREAIMGFQRSKGAKVTGYLTPEQFQTLVGEGE